MKTITNRVVLACFACLVASLAGAADDPLITQIWQTPLNSLLESAPTLADLNADESDEILVAGREELFAVDGTGKELWRWKTEARFMTCPVVPRTPGAPVRIYVADNGGLLTCLDGAGKIVWQAKLDKGSSWSTPVLTDVDEDKALELIQTDESGAVWSFEAATGTVEWKAKVNGIPVSPAVADLDAKRAGLETVISTGLGMLYLIGADGAIVWEKAAGGASPSWATPAPAVFAESGCSGKGLIFVGTPEGSVKRYNADGTLQWTHPTRGGVASSISIAEEPGGDPSIFAITQMGVLYKLDRNGRTVWELDTQGRSLAPGAILDVNGDGKLEYAFCTQAGRFIALDWDGRPLFEHIFDNRTINMTPTFGHVTGQSGEIQMLVTGGESGRLFCFSTKVKSLADAQWIAYRGPEFGQENDARKEGQALVMEPFNLHADMMATGDTIHFGIPNDIPEGARDTAFASCLWPDGSRISASSPVIKGLGYLELPFKAYLPGPYTYEWTLKSSTGEVKSEGSKTLYIQPFATDRAMEARAQSALQETADAVAATLPLTSSALKKEAEDIAAIARKADTLRAGVIGAKTDAINTTLAASTESVERARRASRLATACRDAAAFGTGTSLLVDAAWNPWENRDVDKIVPHPKANPATLSRDVVPGEHDSVVLNVLNITDRELRVRCKVDAKDSGLVAVLHRAQAVPTGQGDVSWDALPTLDPSGIIEIPALTCRQVWVDVAIPTDATGAKTLAVRFEALDGAGILEGPKNPRDAAPPVYGVDVAYDVISAPMADAGKFRLCCWASLGKAEVADLLAHGNNVFCAPLPAIKVEGGEYKSSDYAKLDELVAQLKGHDTVLLLQHYPTIPGKPEEAGYRTILKAYLTALVDHLQAQGIDTKHFALYPADEPGGMGWGVVNTLVDFGRAVRAVRPDVQLYMDGGGELPMFKAMAECIDIWTPGINMLFEKTPEMEFVRGLNRELWSYNCSYSHSSGARNCLKETNVVAEYLIAPMYALRTGATGIGFWSYNLGTDPWTRTELDYPLVYPGENGPVTSRRWEAVREGIEDARLLMALKEKPEAAPIWDSVLPDIVDSSFAAARLGLGRGAVDETSNHSIMRMLREQILHATSPK